jgi:single-strand DNA-binding protein
MSKSRNLAILLGRLGKDPEIRQFSNGNYIAKFSLATEESYKDKDGEKQKIVDWHNIEVYTPGIIQIIQQYVKKGSLLYIEGAMKTQKYSTQHGETKYRSYVRVSGASHKLTLLDKRDIPEEDNNKIVSAESSNIDYQRIKEEGY